jgi:hypothetical protein
MDLAGKIFIGDLKVMIISSFQSLENDEAPELDLQKSVDWVNGCLAL